MKVDYQTALEIASHEAIVREAYRDSKNLWTWSVGLTSATGHEVIRYKDNPQTLEHCLAIYVWALENYAEAVEAEFKDHPLTQAQFAAALSFHWNTGAIRSASWPDLWKQGKIDEARASFMSWRKPPEIIERRAKERDLFFDGKWSNNGTIIEYPVLKPSYTPNWRHAKRINIERELKAAFGKIKRPDEPLKPTPSPIVSGGIGAGVAGSIAAILIIGAKMIVTILLLVAVAIIGYFAWKNPDFRAKIALAFAGIAAAAAAFWDQLSAMWS